MFRSSGVVSCLGILGSAPSVTDADAAILKRNAWGDERGRGEVGGRCFKTVPGTDLNIHIYWLVGYGWRLDAGGRCVGFMFEED